MTIQEILFDKDRKTSQEIYNKKWKSESTQINKCIDAILDLCCIRDKNKNARISDGCSYISYETNVFGKQPRYNLKITIDGFNTICNYHCGEINQHVGDEVFVNIFATWGLDNNSIKLIKGFLSQVIVDNKYIDDCDWVKVKKMINKI